MKLINLKYYVSTVVIALTMASCTKVIDLKLGDKTGELVIEANFTYEHGTQVVKLSRNVPFTSANTYPAVTGATVTMDNHHGRILQFTERTPGYYAVDSIGGTLGRTYTMSVTTADGKTYTADSTMPTQEVPLDSVSSKSNIFDGSKGKKTITIYFDDPAGIKNQYRFVLYVNNVQVKNVFAYNDDFIDGKSVSLDLQENDINIYARDSVRVEMQCIDQPIYTYWFTQAQQQADNPGGAIAPANPPTNFKPTTLGYFSAHTKQSKSIMVQ